MLGEHVQRAGQRLARLDLAGQRLAPCGRDLDQLEGMGRHTQNPAGHAGPMAGTSGALEQARHTLGAADLDHLVDRREIHAQIEAAGGHHTAQPAIGDHRLHPVAQIAIQRTVMQRDVFEPVGSRAQQRLMPELGLRPGVGEQQRGLGGFERGDHRLDQARAQMPGPGKALDGLGNERLDPGLGWNQAANRARRQAAGQRIRRLVEIGQRGRQPPGAQRRPQPPQTRKRQLQLHPALGREQLMPFVDDHGFQGSEQLFVLGIGQQQAQTFRRGDQCTRQLLALTRLDMALGIAGAPLHGPVQPQFGGTGFQMRRGIGGQRPQRRDPEHGQARRGVDVIGCREPVIERAKPGGQRLAGAGRRMDQARFAVRVGRPGLALEVEDLPVARGEPVFDSGGGRRPSGLPCRPIHPGRSSECSVRTDHADRPCVASAG